MFTHSRRKKRLIYALPKGISTKEKVVLSWIQARHAKSFSYDYNRYATRASSGEFDRHSVI